MTMTFHGGPPERGPQTSDTNLLELRAIHQDIGRKACDFVILQNPRTMFESNQDEPSKKILERAYGNFREKVLSETEFLGLAENYDDSTLLVRELFQDGQFNAGFATVQKFLQTLRMVIDKKVGWQFQGVNVSVAGMEFNRRDFEEKYVEDTRGIPVLEYVTAELMTRCPKTLEGTKVKYGMLFACTLHRQAVVENTEPYLDRLKIIKPG